MADNKKIQSDISGFFDRLRGQDKIRKSDSLIVLDTPQSDRERQTKQKISSIVQFVKNKTWSRRHVEFFEEYRRMSSTFPIIKAGLDIYAEETTARDSNGNIFTIKCDNKKVKDLLEELFFKTLALNSKGSKIVRQMCQFGNSYGWLTTRPKDGVTDIVFLPPEAIIRENMYDPSNLENYRFVWYGSGGGAMFEPYEIVHWKNSEDIESEPYGTSILRPIVDTWRRVILIREALVIYRITRAPSKLLFKIGTDGMTGEEAFRFAQEMKKEVQKKPLVNPQTGEIDFKYNPMPLAGYTPIPLLDGRVLTLAELAKEYQEGKQNFVYSIQDNTHQIVPGKIQWAGKNYTANKLVRVWLDNDSYIDSAPEHPFILRDGTTKRADELKEFDSLMPFYEKNEQIRKDSKLEYKQVFNPASGKSEFVHRLVAKEIKKDNDKQGVVHHVDFNRFNNEPVNLQWMTFKDHQQLHNEILVKRWVEPGHEKLREIARKNLTAYNKSPEGRAKVTRCNIERQSHLPLIEYKRSTKGREESRQQAFNMLEKRTLSTSNWKKNMTITFDDYIWNVLRLATINNTITGHMSATKFINNNLLEHLKTVNVRSSLVKGISGNVLRKELKNKGFSSFEEYKTAMKLNHKVARIEILENVSEDVYCMTIVGLNNEDDRHNFATTNVFVKNSIEESIFMPTYEGSPTDVSVLEGASNLDAVEDYKIIKDDLFAGLKIPKSWLSFEEDLCLFPETKIRMLDGNVYSMVELTKRFNKGEKLYVYSTDEEGNIVPGEVEWSGITKREKIKYKITLDNGKTVECTGNHPFRMRDGSYKRADELISGESLMPLYTRITSQKQKGGKFGYEEVWHNGKQEWQETHQMVGEWKYPGYLSRKNTVIHHSSFCKLNNHPDYLVEMDKVEHFKLHSQLADNLRKPENREKLKEIQKTPEYREKCSKSRKKGYENNPWRRNSVSKANKHYNKTVLMRKAYLEKLTLGEISQQKEENGNYKGDIPKDLLLSVLRRNTFCSVIEINEFLKENYPIYRFTYSAKELAEILEIPVSRFNVGILADRKGKTIRFLDLEELEAFAKESVSKRSFYKKVGKSQTGIWNYFTRIGLNFNDWYSSVKEKMLLWNHKVESIEIVSLDIEECVYDLRIKEYHNFALDAGVFVHNSNKAALGEEDIRFAKTIQKIQADFVEGLLHIGLVHLFMKGCSQEEMQSFTIEMNNPSIASEKKKLELIEQRLNIAKSAWDYNNPGLNLMSYVDVLKSILKFTDKEVEQIIKAQFNEKKIAWRLEQLRTNGMYEEPEIEKKLAELKGLTGSGDGKIASGLDSLQFEGGTLTEMLKNKIDEEIREILSPVSATPSAKQVRTLTEGALTKNLRKAKKDFGL